MRLEQQDGMGTSHRIGLRARKTGHGPGASRKPLARPPARCKLTVTFNTKPAVRTSAGRKPLCLPWAEGARRWRKEAAT